MLQQRGFSLLEMVMVVLALSLILVSTAQFLRVQAEYNALKATDRQLQVIREALLGFATLEGQLPCPAANGYGKAETTLCTEEGYLPWADLAIDGRDPWGNIFRYRVDENFVLEIPDDVQTHSNLKITNIAGDNLATLNQLNRSRVVVVVFSTGANRKADNLNDINDKTYAYDEYSDTFDDRLSWIGISDLIGGMMRVGKWPL